MASASPQYWPTDKHGVLLNAGDRARIQPVFQPLIDETIQACTAAVERDLHSLYLVGSMARGEAQPGHSDFDFIAVLEYQVDPELVKQDWIKPTTQRLLHTYSALVTDIEFDLWAQGFIFRDPAEFSPGAFLLATQSVCVWGSDLVPELPRYSLKHLPTLRAIANEDLLYFTDDLDEIEARLKDAASPDEVRQISRTLGKKIARAGFGLALERNRKYTRDVAQCAADFIRAYPQENKGMQSALALYTSPTDSASKIEDVLTHFASHLADLVVDWLDVYNPDWEDFYPIGDEDEDE